MAKETKKETKEDKIKNLDKRNILKKEDEYIATGNYLLDNYFAGFEDIIVGRGGLLRGKVISIAGGPGIGKSTLVLEMCSKLCSQGFKVAFNDVEGGLNAKSLESYGLGNHFTNEAKDFVDGKKLFYAFGAETYSDTIKSFRDLVALTKIDLFVIDSVKQLLPTETFENSDSENDTGALLMDKRIEGLFYPAIKSTARHSNTAVICIQQVRLQKKGMFYVTGETGGNAFLHGMDARFFMKKKEVIEKVVINNENQKVTKDIGTVVEISSLKNRFGMFHITIPLIFGKGMSMIYLYHRLLTNTTDPRVNKPYIELIKNSGSQIFRIPNIYDKDDGEGMKITDKSKIYKMIKDKFFEIEEFILNNNLLYIEKPIEDDVNSDSEINFSNVSTKDETEQE